MPWWWHMTHRDLNNTIMKLHCLECTEISGVFFTLHQGRWRKQVAELVTTVRRHCGLISLLLEGNNKRNHDLKGNKGIKCHCCSHDIVVTVSQQWPRLPLLLLVRISVTLLHNNISAVTYLIMFSSSGLGSCLLPSYRKTETDRQTRTGP